MTVAETTVLDPPSDVDSQPPTSAERDRFARAAAVQLVGEMRDVGFQDAQWLVQRDGAYIQLSEVLYRILEFADGERTAAELAAAVTDHSKWSVDEATVRALIDTKLAPLGLIAGARTAPTAPAAVDFTTASPLRLQMRMKMVPQRFIDPLTAWLQFLFAPAALLASGLAIGATHWWMYGIHGVRTSVSEVLYTPGALLLTFAIIVAAAVVHELGHASALRYGGGRGRGIGVGLYLIFPAFFTDATDGYRLGRMARVRTDVGGIYFHLLCSVALIVAARALDSELLLFPAFLLNVEAVRQLIPFLQLDGYWLLADLTGIPDFFSQMAAFVRSVVPARWQRGTGTVLPPLRRLAKTVFASYTLLVIPLLVYLIFLMVAYLPEFARTTAKALFAQGQLLNSDEAAGTIALALTQMFFLVLPLIGALLVLGTIGRTVASRIAPLLPPPARRLAAAACMVTVAAAVMIWVDGEAYSMDAARFSLGGSSTRGKALIETARQTTAAMSSLEADIEGRLGDDHFTGTLAVKRPNLARVEIASNGGLGEVFVNSDGKDLFVYFPGDNQYTRSAPLSNGRNINGFLVDHVRYFFEPDTIAAAPKGGRVTAEGARTLDGVEGELFSVAPPKGPGGTVSLFITRDGVVRRVARGAAADDLDHAISWVSLKNIRAGSDIAAARFQWQLPNEASALALPLTIPWSGQQKP